MERNVGNTDRIIRLVIGIVLIGVGFGAISGIAGTIIGVIGIFLVITGILARCILYNILGINTYIRI